MPAKIEDRNSGVTIGDLLDSREFTSRRRKHADPSRRAHAVKRLDQCLSESPEAILQALLEIAVEFSNADSAGISLEEENKDGKLQFRWVAVAGSFERYLNGTTPRFYSPCGTCMDRGAAQHYTVAKPYYNFLGVEAEPILDGLLIPWRVGRSQGTVWLVSHRSESAFDLDDYEFLRMIADHVATRIGTVNIDMFRKQG